MEKKRPKIVRTITSGGKVISLLAFPSGSAKVFEHDPKKKIVTRLFPTVRRVDIIAAEFERLREKLTGKEKRILKLKRHGGSTNDRERSK